MPAVGFQFNISTQRRLTTVEQFEDVVLRAASYGGLVRIRDVGRVELGAKTRDSSARYNSKPASGIGIYQSPGANGIAVADQIRVALKEIEPRLPDDVAYDVMYDTTVFVHATIEKVEHTLLEAFVLVAIVVFIFLGSLRATLIPIVAVPVALIGHTFAVMLVLQGFLRIFVIPGLYVLLETFREKVKSLAGGQRQITPPHSVTETAPE